MRYEDLDLKQEEAVKAIVQNDSKILVLGGAGTGKTTVALWCARKLLEQPAYASSRVLFLTFSRSAISQIIRRSPGIISGYERHVEIMTFHSLAYRLLSSFGRYSGYGTEPLSIQSEARKKLFGNSAGQLGYDDLLPGVIELLKNPRILRLAASRWTLIICDEVQDTNVEQWNILRILSPPNCCFWVMTGR